MSKLWSNWKPVLLLGIVTVIWVTLNARWMPATWSSSGGIAEGDFLEVAARVQISAEQLGNFKNTYGIIDRLGAPFGANWAGYPVPDRLIFGLAGVLAKLFGVMPAINLIILLGLLLNSWSFYGCVRALRWHPAWACAGAILFGFSVYNLHWAGTLSLGLTFALPPAVLCLHWIASRNPAPPPRMARRMTWLAALLGLWIGAANPYFTYFVFVLLGLSLLLQATRQRVPARLKAGGLWLLAMLLSFALTHAAYFVDRLSAEAHAGAVQRNYAGTELYALRPIELILPPSSHRISALSELGAKYRQQSLFQSREPSANYLGIVGVAGLGILSFAALRHAAAGLRGKRVLPAALPAVIFTLLYTCVGGINGMVAYFGLDWFRATNRLSIFLLIWCLFVILSRLQDLTRGTHPLLRCLAALGLVGLGLYDTLPRGLSAINHQAGLGQLQADHAAVKELSELLPSGAMIFQLPVTIFPEAGPRASMGDYEHFRFFLAGHGMKYSYGSLAGSKMQLWSEYVAGLSAVAMVRELTQTGFAAVLIDRRGYSDDASGLIAEFTAAGHVVSSLEDRPEISFVILQPTAESRLPDLSVAKIYPFWDSAASSLQITLHAIAGWFDLETTAGNNWRWGGSEAVLGIWNKSVDSREVVLSARIKSVSNGVLTITHNGQLVRQLKLSRGQIDPLDLTIILSPGSSQMEWRFDGPLVRPRGDPRDLGFQVEELRIDSIK